MSNEIQAIGDPTGADISNLNSGVDGVDMKLTTKQQAAGLDLSNGADMADAANSAQHDLAQKKAKLANHAHESTESVDSDFTPEEQNRKGSPFARAWQAMGSKVINGAMMFAGFSVLLAGSLFGISEVLGSAFGEAFIKEGVGKLISTVAAAATTGAAWLGGHEFMKVYKAEKAKEDSRLNKTLEKVKEKFGHSNEHSLATEKEIGELGILSGSLSSHLGTTAFLIEVPNEMVELPANQNVKNILAQGPRNAREIATNRGAENLSATERLEAQQSSEQNQSISV